MSCGIYKITNTINNKSYIGQSCNIEERWKRHKYAKDNFAIHLAIQKYGIVNFSFSILEECSKEQLNDKEIYWIEYYNSIEDGYNMIPGGSNGAGYAKGIKVQQYNLDGSFIKEYESALQAANETLINHSDICRCCRKEISHAGKFQWKYSNSNKQICPINIDKLSIQKEINQYDLQGKLVNTYPSLAEAERMTGIRKSTICSVCKGKGKTAGGYRWSYTDKQLDMGKQKSGIKKKVYQYDKNFTLIKIFDSITEASKVTQITLSGISETCRGKRKTAGGYIWSFKEIEKENNNVQEDEK